MFHITNYFPFKLLFLAPPLVLFFIDVYLYLLHSLFLTAGCLSCYSYITPAQKKYVNITGFQTLYYTLLQC